VDGRPGRGRPGDGGRGTVRCISGQPGRWETWRAVAEGAVQLSRAARGSWFHSVGGGAREKRLTVTEHKRTVLRRQTGVPVMSRARAGPRGGGNVTRPGPRRWGADDRRRLAGMSALIRSTSRCRSLRRPADGTRAWAGGRRQDLTSEHPSRSCRALGRSPGLRGPDVMKPGPVIASDHPSDTGCRSASSGVQFSAMPLPDGGTGKGNKNRRRVERLVAVREAGKRKKSEQRRTRASSRPCAWWPWSSSAAGVFAWVAPRQGPRRPGIPRDWRPRKPAGCDTAGAGPDRVRPTGAEQEHARRGCEQATVDTTRARHARGPLGPQLRRRDNDPSGPGARPP